MAICPFAVQQLIPKWNKVRITRYRRMNLHVAVSEAQTIYSMFSQSNAACSHFYVAKDGQVYQYIDTRYRSASDMNGNDSTISVETQGGVKNPDGEPWTPAQLVSLAKLWAWARDTHKIKNQVAKGTQTNDDSSGLSWHRQGVQGNFSNRKGILSISYKPGGILYSKARGKICPGDAKILQIPGIWREADGKSWKEIGKGDTKPAGQTKPAGKPSKPVDKSGAWPEKPLPITDKHTVQSDAAWRELMAAIGYKDKDLGLALQKWLAGLTDPRTGRGYYDTKRFKLDGDFSSESVKALQRKLYDTKGDDGKRLYNGKSDGDRGGMTVRAEIGYLNLKANRGVK